MPFTKNCVEKIVLPQPAAPETRIERPSENPPSITSSKPRIPVATRSMVSIITPCLKKLSCRLKAHVYISEGAKCIHEKNGDDNNFHVCILPLHLYKRV